MTKRIDFTPGTDAYSLVTTIKKSAAKDEQAALQLYAHGYRFPTHSKKPPIVRQFVCWDGEGITYPGDKAQSYVLFGASTGDRIIKPALGTRDCLDLLLAVEMVHPDAIHVGFALQYDCNMILRDLTRRHLVRLYHTNKCTWEGYRIEYRPGKWLSIRRGNVRVRLFDVFGFFQTSFVTACEKFLGAGDPELVRIREGKNARKSFAYEQLDTYIVPYWEGELRLMTRLMESLREDLHEAGIDIVSWHGPGAVANKVLRSNGVHLAKKEAPSEVNRAAQYAYAGGRFELFRAGHYPGTVWEYDINSAYPAAIATLPNLFRGEWIETTVFDPESFGVWLVRHDDRSNPRQVFTKPQPLFNRDRHGNVSFPPITEGWYWTPEAALCPSEVVRGWVFERDDDDKPFEFVREMYERRQEWKSQGKSAEKALKLALNSLYGKMAQRVGYTETQGIPKWHQLEWAGFVTSATRARLWAAICLVPSAVIAVETDAIFVSQKLALDVGTKLGQWEATKFDALTYIQSGVYFTETDGVLSDKYRGFDKGSLSHDEVMAYLARVDAGVKCGCKPPKVSPKCPAHLFGVTTRFTGLGVALHTRRHWRSWVTEPRHVSLGGGGKRNHVRKLCPECKAGLPFTSSLHTLAVTTAGGRSFPHDLPWLAGAESTLRDEDAIRLW